MTKKKTETAPPGENTQEYRTRTLHLSQEHMDEESSVEIDLTGGLQDIFDALPYYVLLVDSDHRIVMANKAVTAAHGVAFDALNGQYCPKAIHGVEHAFPGCPLEEAVRCGGSVEKELYDAQYGVWLESVVYPTNYETDDGRKVFYHTARDITARKKTELDLEASLRTKEVLHEILALGLESKPLDEQLMAVLNLILTLPWLGVEKKGAMFLTSGSPMALEMKAQIGLATPLLETCASVPLGHCLCGRAAGTGELQFSSNLDERHSVTYDGITDHGHYCVPIKHKGEVVGVMNLYLAAGHERDPENEEFLLAVANVLAGTIRRMQSEEQTQLALQRVKTTLTATGMAISKTLEMRDPYTAGHQQRVAQLARAIATEMELPEGTIEGIHLAALLHDIGKIHVPAEILSKPGRLSAIEFSLIKTHPGVGYDILKAIDFSWPIADVVHQHHEKLDGTGYPQGLKGEEIRPEAMILAVADVVEAVASHRPYRPALGIERALQILEEGKGTHFDPVAVEACLSLFKTRGFEFSS